MNVYDGAAASLTPAEKFQYDDVMKTVGGTMHAFEEQLSRTRERLTTYTPAFRILESPSVRVAHVHLRTC